MSRAGNGGTRHSAAVSPGAPGTPAPAEPPANGPAAGSGTAAGPEGDAEPAARTAPPALELEQLQEAWRRSILPAVEQRSSPTAAILGAARPAGLAGDTLTLEFSSSSAFHRQRAEEPRNVALLEDALYEVTGRRLELVYATGEAPDTGDTEPEHPLSEDEIVELMKSTFDAQELDH